MAGSFLARKWPDSLAKALGERIKVIPNGYQAWTHGRQPFIRVTSNVKINGNSTLREKFQLFSGNLRGLKSSYDLNNRNEPFPGITSLTIKDTGSQGALRKIQYNFQCWSLEQLKAHEALYMSLGTFQCVEWGWTTKPNGSRVSEKMPLGKGGMLGSMSDFYKKVRQLSKSASFCYDAAKGKVSNFSWSVNEVGGFDCMVELTSMGNILLESPTKTSSVSNGCLDADDKENENGIADTKRPNPKTIFSFLYETLETGEAYKVNGINGSPVFAGTAIKFDKDVSDEEEDKESDEQAFNADEDYYITFDFFEEKVINNLLFPKLNPNTGTKEKDADPAITSDIEDNKKHWINKIWPSFKNSTQAKFLVARSNNGIGVLDSRGTLIPNFANDLISSDPGVCLLPGQEHWRDYEDGSHEYRDAFAAAAAGLATTSAVAGVTGIGAPVAIVTGGLALIAGGIAWAMSDNNVNAGSLKALDEAVEGGLKFKYGEDSLTGVLSSVLLNVRHLEKSLDEADTVAEYIQKILDDVSSACANQFDMQVVEDPDNPAILRIVESGTVDEDEKEKVIVFPSMGPESVVRSINVETKLSGKIAAQVMYGTNRQKDSHDMGDDGSAGEFSFWNAQVVDMDYQNIKMIDALKKDEECCSNDQNGPISKDEQIKSIIATYLEARKELAENVGVESVEAANTSTKKKIELLVAGEAGTSDGGSKVPINLKALNAVLPIELSLSIDGISGIKWGLPLSVSYLPERYRGVYFTTIGIDHTIDLTGWTTSIGTVMRGNSGAIGSTGFPAPAPIEEEAQPGIRQTPPPPPPPPPIEEQPIAEPEPEEEPIVEPEPEPEEEPVEERHIDVPDGPGTPDMILFNGNFVYGGGNTASLGEAFFVDKYSLAERTFKVRLIQQPRDNQYRVELDKHEIIKDGKKRILGPIKPFQILTAKSGAQRIAIMTNSFSHDESGLQDLISSIMDPKFKQLEYHSNGYPNLARKIYFILLNDFRAVHNTRNS